MMPPPHTLLRRFPLLAVAAAVVAFGLFSLTACGGSSHATRDTPDREGDDDYAAPAWLRVGFPDTQHYYAVGTVIFPDRMHRRDAIRRAHRDAQEKIAAELERHFPTLRAYLAEHLSRFTDAEARIQAEAEAFARAENVAEVIPNDLWLALRIHQNLLLTVQEETLEVSRYEAEEADQIDVEATYYDGRTGERRATPDPKEKRRQLFVLGGVSRSRLLEVFRQQSAVYGITWSEDEGPAYLLLPSPDGD